MNKSCGLCVDNGGTHTLEIQTDRGGSTGPIPICWPCLQTRLEKLTYDVDRSRDDGSCRLGNVVGFTVTAPRSSFWWPLTTAEQTVRP